ncbi:MAG: hypothetical protein ACT4NT_08195 [Nitrososphaerota archaeon]
MQEFQIRDYDMRMMLNFESGKRTVQGKYRSHQEIRRRNSDS